ncbi:MAG: cupredoxin domain-containing protein [Leptolyngbyaceae cyanobacterium bins.302]|nr:cupredoxin domain-containing protein [Leptolyngbyaceae cyanobacterium bins.302]
MRSPAFFPYLCGFLCGFIGWISLVAWTTPAIAATPSPDPSRQPAVEVTVHLGNSANELRFFPDTTQFAAGKRYKLVLDNPSAGKHYFTAKDFADGIWSQKVEAGKVEIKGAIHDLELKPGAIAEWFFIPLKPGTYELHCSIPGHTEAGMVGKLVVD